MLGLIVYRISGTTGEEGSKENVLLSKSPPFANPQVQSAKHDHPSLQLDGVDRGEHGLEARGSINLRDSCDWLSLQERMEGIRTLR